MGIPCVTKPFSIILLFYLLDCFKFITRALLTKLGFPDPPEQEQGHDYGFDTHEHTSNQDQAPPPLVASDRYTCTPLEKLPTSQFLNFLMKSDLPEEGNNMCTIRLCKIKGSDEIREPMNCIHPFHRDCLDSWIGEGHHSCPLCRNLLFQTSDLQFWSDDPWVMEQNIYMQGEDNSNL